MYGPCGNENDIASHTESRDVSGGWRKEGKKKGMNERTNGGRNKEGRKE
jgi:hypothetical protein